MALEWPHQTRMYWNIHTIPRTYKTRESFTLMWGFIGLATGVYPLKGVKQVVSTCSPGNDIFAKISLVCESQNRMLLATLCITGNVMGPSLIHHGNQIKTYEGVYSIVSMSMVTPFGPNDDPATTCTISIAGKDHKVYGGRVSGPLIAASPIIMVLLLDMLVEDSDDDDDSDDEYTSDETDTSEDSDSSDDGDSSDSCLTCA